MQALVDAVIANAGGDESSYLDFSYQGVYCCLSIREDLLPLNSMAGKFLNHSMDWFRVWYNPQVVDVNCHVMSPYLLPTLMKWVRGPMGEGSESFVQWVTKKWPMPGSETKTILVPYTCGSHWSLFLLSDECFLHYDSMQIANMHAQRYMRVYLAKMWAAWRGFRAGSAVWKKCSACEIWMNCDVTQQITDWECGFYVLKCIMETCSRKRTVPTFVCENYNLHFDQSEAMEARNVIRATIYQVLAGVHDRNAGWSWSVAPSRRVKPLEKEVVFEAGKSAKRKAFELQHQGVAPGRDIA